MVARGSMSAVYKLLRERFGRAAFQAGQEELVARLLAGGEVAAEFAAGSGERLCYQLLAWIWELPTLVITPHRGSMRQEVERLKGKGLAVAGCEAAAGSAAIEAMGARLQSRQLRLLYLTEEVLHDPAMRRMLEGTAWALVVVEQAQQACMASPQYRPGWQGVLRWVRGLSAQRRLYLAETGSPGAVTELGREAVLVRGPWWRANVALHARRMGRHHHVAHVLGELAARPAGAALIDCRDPRHAETMAAAIAAKGRAARAVHGGMKQQERQAVYEWFLGSEQPILVTASSASSLPHRADLRAVYLCQLPADCHELLGMAGRAGRDGLPAVCCVLMDPGDRVALENQIRGTVPDARALHALAEKLLSGPQHTRLSKHQLAHRHDIAVRWVEDVLGWLALEGVLSEGATSPRELRFRCLEPLPRLVRRFEGERREFLKRVFATARRARSWHHLDMEAARSRLGAALERAVAALQYLGRCGLVELRSGIMQTDIQRAATVPDAAGMVRSLRQQVCEVRDRRLRALASVCSVFAHHGCWLERLAGELGYKAEGPCGSCTWCTSGCSLETAFGEPALPAGLWPRLRAAQAEHAETLMPLAAAARFLCGICTPRLARERLTRHPLFGACRHIPIGEVYRQVREQGTQPLLAG